eukprot:11038576-Karenia_brevis.AAC.1
MVSLVCPRCLKEAPEHMLRSNGKCNACTEELLIAARSQCGAAPSSKQSTAEPDNARSAACPASRPCPKRPAAENAEQLHEQQLEEGGDSGASDVAHPATSIAVVNVASQDAAQEEQQAHQNGVPAIDWSQSWYDILGIARTAHASSIAAAHKRLSILYHPDKA